MRVVLCVLACCVLATRPAWGADPAHPEAGKADPHAAAEKPAPAEAGHPPAAAKPHGDPAHPGGEHPADGGHEPRSPIEWKTDLALWTLVTFVVFCVVLAKLAWQPLIRGLDTREAKIRQDIENAEQARIRAEKMLAEHSAKMAQVQEEIRGMLAEARRDAEHAKQEIMAQADKEAKATMARAAGEIEQFKNQALDELFAYMSGAVSNAAEQVVGRSLKDGDHDRLVNEALTEFSRQRSAAV